MEEKDKSLDVFGIRPYGESIKIAVDKSIEGAGAFLSRICLPVAEEFGLLLRDKIRYWRVNNIIKILEKAKDKIKYEDGEIKVNAHPRIVMKVIEEGSWNENDEIQEMWAGLLAASCDKVASDENLIFINLLNQLTNSEAKILNHICERTPKTLRN